MNLVYKETSANMGNCCTTPFFLENSFQKHKILTSLEAILERFIF